MKRLTLTICILAMLITISIAYPVPAAHAALTVRPTPSTVFINGAETAFEAYLINGNNYFKLRDIAYALTGTDKQFEVGYDIPTRKITLTTGQPYTTVGGEMMPGSGSSASASLNGAINISMDGTAVNVTAYLIKGYNFMRLRDLMELLDVGVGYDRATRNITIDTTLPYETDLPHDEQSIQVPILMYHRLEESGAPGTVVSPEMFDSHMKALSEAGYTAISFEQLSDYMTGSAQPPERPVMITFDDGYMSVYDSAFPILRKYNMKATAFIIGISHGESIYKGNPDFPIIPHFGDSEAREMVASGIFSIQSHSFDMHQHIPFETGPLPPRRGILQRAGESEEDYINAFISDFTTAAAQIENAVGERPFVYSYPFGLHTDLSESLLEELGVTITVTTAARINILQINSPESLFGLGRFNVRGDMTADELLSMISSRTP